MSIRSTGEVDSPPGIKLAAKGAAAPKVCVRAVATAPRLPSGINSSIAGFRY